MKTSFFNIHIGMFNKSKWTFGVVVLVLILSITQSCVIEVVDDEGQTITAETSSSSVTSYSYFVETHGTISSIGISDNILISSTPNKGYSEGGFNQSSSSNELSSSSQEGSFYYYSSSYGLSSSSEGLSSSARVNEFVDARDGKHYKKVTIGSQIWMAENLNYGQFVESIDSTTLQSKGQKFCFQNHEENCDVLGGIYQWATVMNLDKGCNDLFCDPVIKALSNRGICPVGWHVPSHEDWSVLESSLGWVGVGKHLKTAEWGGSNSSGFNGMAVGILYENRDFEGLGNYTGYWTSTESGSYENIAEFYNLDLMNDELYSNKYYKTGGYSVRCISDYTI